MKKIIFIVLIMTMLLTIILIKPKDNNKIRLADATITLWINN